MKFDQDLCGTCDMNSTLGSAVPLAMFHLCHGHEGIAANVVEERLVDDEVGVVDEGGDP